MSALRLLPKLAVRHPSFMRVKQGLWQNVETSLPSGLFLETSRHDADYFIIKAVLLPLAAAGGVLVLNWSSYLTPVSTKGHWIWSAEREAELLDEIDQRWTEAGSFLENGSSPERFCAWLCGKDQTTSDLTALGYYGIYAGQFDDAASCLRRSRDVLRNHDDPSPWMPRRADEIEQVLSALERDPAEAVRMLDARCHSSRVALNLVPKAA